MDRGLRPLDPLAHRPSRVQNDAQLECGVLSSQIVAGLSQRFRRLGNLRFEVLLDLFAVRALVLLT